MAKITFVLGLVLIVIGLVGFYASGAVHPTALIPAGLGVILVICGSLAFSDKFRKHAMHAAAVVGLLGCLGTLTFIPGLFKMLTGGTVAQPLAVYSKAATFVVCAVFVYLCVQSFIAAKKARLAKAAAEEKE